MSKIKYENNFGGMHCVTVVEVDPEGCKYVASVVLSADKLEQIAKAMLQKQKCEIAEEGETKLQSKIKEIANSNISNDELFTDRLGAYEDAGHCLLSISQNILTWSDGRIVDRYKSNLQHIKVIEAVLAIRNVPVESL